MSTLMRSSSRAFSLMEILITGVVIAMAMTPLLLHLKTSTRAVSGTREMLSAVALAQRTLEELRRAAFRPVRAAGLPAGALPSLDEAAAAMNAPGALDPAGQGNTLAENGVAYQRRVRLIPERAQDLAPGMPDLRVCQVEVTWKATAANLLGNHRYQLHSLIGSGTQP